MRSDYLNSNSSVGNFDLKIKKSEKIVVLFSLFSQGVAPYFLYEGPHAWDT